MEDNIQSMILGLVSALGGGVGAAYIAKTFLANYIKSNDEKHTDARKDLKEISSKVSDVKTDIAIINTKLDLITGVGDKVIILEQTCNKHGKDITAAFEKIRSVSK